MRFVAAGHLIFQHRLKQTENCCIKLTQIILQWNEYAFHTIEQYDAKKPNRAGDYVMKQEAKRKEVKKEYM